MNGFIWETHMHTSESSRCAQNTAAEMVRAYHEAGYYGVVITDHFVNGYSYGNVRVPWQTRIDLMLKGYRAARACGERLGLAVLLGWEYPYAGGDYLTYGLGEDFLRDNPDLGEMDIDAYVDCVHAAGGFISQAHPYRTAAYMPKKVDKRWDIVDGIEVINGSHIDLNPQWDADALALAVQHDRVQTAGSDAHSLEDVGRAGMLFETPFVTNDALLAALRERQGRPVQLYEPT